MDTRAYLSIAEVLKSWAEQQPQKTAYVWLDDAGEVVSQHCYASLLGAGLRFAERLALAGLERGDRVVLVCDHTMEFLEAFWGCLFFGAVAVPMPAPKRNRKSERVDTILEDCGARMIVHGKEFTILPSTGENSRNVPEDLLMIQYTSGSTSAPKGVCITNACLRASMLATQYLFQYRHDEIQVGWLPLFHDMGLFGHVVSPIFCGATSILMSPTAFLRHPVLWLRAISRFGGTFTGAPNFAFDLCCERITEEEKSKLDLSSLRLIYCAAEPIRALTIRRFCDDFAPCGFAGSAYTASFGMAETTLTVTVAEPGYGATILKLDSQALRDGIAEIDASGDIESVSCGPPDPAHRLRIVDPDTLLPLEERAVGELWINGPAVGAGYWNKPEVTEEIFGAYTADGEGPFLRTGDLAFLHNGNLHIAGRLKDLIIVGGRNHHPHDIELTVEQCHPAMHPGGVAAFSDGASPEKLMVVAELRRTALRDATEPIIDAILRDVAAEHDVVVDVVVLIKPMTLPKTTSGKVRRKETRRALLANELEMVAMHGTIAPAPPTVPEAKSAPADLAPAILAALGEVVRKDMTAFGPDRPLSAAGLDSIQTMELIVALEELFSVSIDGEEISPAMSAHDLEALIAAKRSGDDGAPARKALATAPSHRTLPEYFEGAFPPGDLFARCDEFAEFLADWKSQPTYSFFNQRSPSKGTEVALKTPRSPAPRRVVSFSGYDYLGLSWHPEVIAAGQEAMAEYGVSPTGTPVLSGGTKVQRDLEEYIAALLHQEDCALFNSGFAANVGSINALMREGDLVIADVLSHASLYDGMNSSAAVRKLFQHNRADHLRSLLMGERGNHNAALTITEGLFSMEGDVAPLPAVISALKNQRTRLLVDEAHSFGVIGPTGLGAVERHNAFHQVDLITGSLGKAPGGGGGFVAGPRRAIEWIRHLARPGLFSGGVSPAVSAATLRALEIQRREPGLLASLRANIAYFTKGLGQVGFKATSDPESPIVPVVIGDEEKLAAMNEVLLECGVFTSPVIFPAVPKNASRFRISLSARHTREHLDRMLDALQTGRTRVDPE